MNTDAKITGSQFFRLLPAQMLIPAIASVIAIANGIIAGKFIEESAVGAVGLYAVMTRITEAVGMILLAGSAVMCGRSMGEGNLEKTGSLFSLNLFITTVFSAVITLASLTLADPLAAMFGATGYIRPLLAAYIRGMGIGMFPTMMACQLVSFLQLERKSRLTYIASVAMLVSNVGLAYVFVGILDMGITGLAYATSAANWIYLFILGSYYLTGKAQLKFSFKSIKFGYLWEMITVGAPGALLSATLAVQNLVVFRIALAYGGESALSALSSYLMSANIVICYSLGCGNVVRNMASVSLGERDRASLHELFDTLMKKAFPLSFPVTALVLFITRFFPALFFSAGSQAYVYARQLFTIIPCFIPLLLLTLSVNGYLQAKEHKVFCMMSSVFDGIFSITVPALILTPLFGTTGLWISYPLGFFFVFSFAMIYCCIYWKRIPRSKDDLLFLKEDFDVPEKDRFDCDVYSIDDIMAMVDRVHAFCTDHNLVENFTMHTELFLEEMATNVVLHGFTKDKKKHSVQIRIVYEKDNVILRIKDDCILFNPMERVKNREPSKRNPGKDLGIRMVLNMAKDVKYQNLVGLNVLTIIV